MHKCLSYSYYSKKYYLQMIWKYKKVNILENIRLLFKKF